MEHPELEFAVILGHCGDLQVHCIEWPPAVVVCPSCSHVLGLEEFDEESGQATFIRIK